MIFPNDRQPEIAGSKIKRPNMKENPMKNNEQPEI